MVRRCIAPIYDPRPRSEEVCSSITLEPEGRVRYWTTNFLWPRSRVEYWCNSPTNHDLYNIYYDIQAWILHICMVSLFFCAISMVIDFDLIGRFKSIRIFIYILLSLFESLNCYLKNELFGVISLCGLPGLGYFCGLKWPSLLTTNVSGPFRRRILTLYIVMERLYCSKKRLTRWPYCFLSNSLLVDNV